MLNSLTSNDSIRPNTMGVVDLHTTNMAATVICESCLAFLFSGRELAFTFAICYRRSVCLSSVCLSVTLVRPTPPVEIFGNFFHHTIAQGL